MPNLGSALRPARPAAPSAAGARHDPMGLLMVVAAAMILLAFISYDPQQLPAWIPGSVDSLAVNAEEAGNFIGLVGTLCAWAGLWVAGWAIYLLPLSLTWFGVCKLRAQVAFGTRGWAGVVLMIVAASSLFAVQGILDQHDSITPHGGGGGLGFLIGKSVLVGLMGVTGSTILLAVLYMAGFLLASGLQVSEVMAEIRQEFAAWNQRRQMALLNAEEFQEDAAMIGRISRSPRPKAVRPGTTLITPELPLVLEPKIIDSSVKTKTPESSASKPKLSEVWRKKREQKFEQARPGSSSSLTVLFKDYQLPDVDLLHWPEEAAKPADRGEMMRIQETIVRALASFNVKVEPGDITRGPAITRYEVRPVDGLRVSRIAALEDDLARATCAERVNILAPIPGKDTVGIELANSDKVVVPIRELLEDDVFTNGRARIPIALGKDVYGKAIVADLASMPHLLVAGATGSGKSVCINGIITSLLCRFAPDELRLIMIDPKVVEMQTYATLPHLALPVVTEPKKALAALRWVVREMEDRYKLFAQTGCRNFETFNNRTRPGTEAAAPNEEPKSKLSARKARLTSSPPLPFEEGEEPVPQKAANASSRRSSAFARAAELADAAQEGRHPDQVRLDYVHSHEDDADEDPFEDELERDPDADADEGLEFSDQGRIGAPATPQEKPVPDTLPYIVVIIDELADLMQTAPADIEGAIARITQMARAAGIHLIVATQTPRADVITGVIKANIPTRIAFQVASALDSRVILDRKGAENLVGKGDMLYMPPGGAQAIRSQGALVTDAEIHAIVDHCSGQGNPCYEAASQLSEGGAEGEEEGEGGISSEEEAVLERCLEVMRQERKASTSLFQRRLRLGYGRAARMMDLLEMRGIIGPGEGAKPREILVSLDTI